MPPGIDHVMINCLDYASAIRFYAWLLPEIGYPESMALAQPGPTTGWYGAAGSVWVSQAADLQSPPFSKERVGLREIAFRAESRAQIDRLAAAIASHGGRILDPPREYDYVPGYYAVFFTDPDGIKLELMHLPQHQS
ncbi:MAG TPA: VOC family protein [Candidatus Binataceae bacterium]|nr:VOC family protein [Candidatus Binataceae bacterium]